MADSFAARRGEGFHGFGGRHGKQARREALRLDRAGEPRRRSTLSATQLLPPLTVDWSDYTWTSSAAAPIPDGIPGGFERFLFPNGPNAAYYPQAQFVSSRGYGFLLNQTEYSRWRMANDRRTRGRCRLRPRLDYTVVFGPTRQRAARG